MVINACKDKTKDIVEKCGIRTIEENTKWISYARETWLEKTNGEIILWIDADTKVKKSWIDEHIKYYKDSEVWWVAL